MSDETGGMRTPEDNPQERITDQGFLGRLRAWWGAGRGYRDVWLLIITILLVLALDSIQDERARATRISCMEQNARHDETIVETYRLVIEGSTEVAKSPADRRRIEQIAAEASTATLEELPNLVQETTQHVTEEGNQLIATAVGQTTRLVDALAPKRDCDALVERNVGGGFLGID
jgi:hypothetical protein